MADRQLSLSIDRSQAPYASLDRVFHRLTFTITEAVGITTNLFVVDTVIQPGSNILLYPATPADLANIPEDVANADGYLRVSEVTINFDNLNDTDQMIQSVSDRLKLLLDTLNTLDGTDTVTNIVIANG